LNNHLNVENENSLNIKLGSSYTDIPKFIEEFANSKKPIYLSLNIQSLMSKFDSLKLFVTELKTANVPIDVIALQETWSVNYPDLVQLPGFQSIIFSGRALGRGGGVGFYIREGLHFEKIENLSTFTDKTFECLSIEMHYPNKKIILSNIYRSPNPPPNCSATDHISRFTLLLNAHLNDLYNRGRMAVVFLDSNINLHSIQADPIALNYLNSVLACGFIQTITRSTRVQGNSHSLIDHILINKNLIGSVQGTLVSDLSDHFINFHQVSTADVKQKQKLQSSRRFTAENMDRFKLLLRGTNWIPTLESNDVDVSFGVFWNEFKQLYDVCFPLTVTKLNRNIHRINGYMTTGLLISRSTKNNLHKASVLDPTLQNTLKYRTYRNLYNTVIRKSKKMYFEKSLNENVKNPKKTWEILKEATVGSKPNKKIERLTVNGNTISDHLLIAEEFNTFFTKIGTSISESVRPTNVDPIDLMPNNPNIIDLDLTLIGPNYLCELIKTF